MYVCVCVCVCVRIPMPQRPTVLFIHPTGPLARHSNHKHRTTTPNHSNSQSPTPRLTDSPHHSNSRFPLQRPISSATEALFTVVIPYLTIQLRMGSMFTYFLLEVRYNFFVFFFIVRHFFISYKIFRICTTFRVKRLPSKFMKHEATFVV